jgi:HSP20 family molecular chaperone IbpA
MSKVPVKTVNSAKEALAHLAELMKSVCDEVRERAYRLFLEKGGGDGHDLEDWLTAERELLCAPPCELTETEHEIRIKAEVPGFDVKALQVDVLPESITIEGYVEKKEEGKGAKTLIQKRLLRQFELPARVDPQRVKATLENDLLEVVAKKEVSTVTPIVNKVNTHSAAA